MDVLPIALVALLALPIALDRASSPLFEDLDAAATTAPDNLDRPLASVASSARPDLDAAATTASSDLEDLDADATTAPRQP